MLTTQTQDARAQAIPELKNALVVVNNHIVRSAELVPEASYGYRPANSVRTFLQLIAHAADGNNYACGLAAGNKTEWAETEEKATRTKADALRALKASVDACNAVMDGADVKQAPLIENLAHANLHYGNIIVYLRGMGITPPSSQ